MRTMQRMPGFVVFFGLHTPDCAITDSSTEHTKSSDKSEPRDVAVQQQEEKNLGETYTYAQYSTHNPIAKQVLGPPLQKNFVRF